MWFYYITDMSDVGDNGMYVNTIHVTRRILFVFCLPFGEQVMYLNWISVIFKLNKCL